MHAGREEHGLACAHHARQSVGIRMALGWPLSGYSDTVELTLPSQKIDDMSSIPTPYDQILLFSVARGAHGTRKARNITESRFRGARHGQNELHGGEKKTKKSKGAQPVLAATHHAGGRGGGGRTAVPGETQEALFDGDDLDRTMLDGVRL